jgi:hypothetical protein
VEDTAVEKHVGDQLPDHGAGHHLLGDEAEPVWDHGHRATGQAIEEPVARVFRDQRGRVPSWIADEANLGPVSIGNSGTLNIDNGTTNLPNRTGATTNLTLLSGDVTDLYPHFGIDAEPPAGTFDVSDPSELVQEVEQFLRDRDEG